MTILDILRKLVTGKSNLIKLLEKVRDEAPDLGPQAQEWIDVLNSAASSDNLSRLASAIVAELGQIAKGKLDPRDSPSGAI